MNQFLSKLQLCLLSLDYLILGQTWEDPSASSGKDVDDSTANLAPNFKKLSPHPLATTEWLVKLGDKQSRPRFRLPPLNAKGECQRQRDVPDLLLDMAKELLQEESGQHSLAVRSRM